MYQEDDEHRWVSLQTQADVSTFICAFCFFFLIYALENPPSGGAALGIIFPLIIVVILHLSVGLHALMCAMSVGNFKRNFWIYGYFLVVVLTVLGYMGFHRAISESFRASVETHQYPLEEQLFSAIEGQQIRDVERFVREGADPNFCFENIKRLDGYSALQLGVSKKNVNLTNVLLDAGARPDFTCPTKRVNGPMTALNTAAHDNSVEIVEALLAKGADPNLGSTGTPLGHAISLNRSLPSPSGYFSPPTEQDRERKRETVQLLLEAGALVNVDHHEYSPLLRAITTGDLELVSLLLIYGADASAKGKENESAFYLAARYGHSEILGLLLSQPVESIQGIDAFHTLRVAGRNRDEKSLNLLVAHGLRVDGFYDPSYLTAAREVLYPGIDVDDELADAIKDGNWLYVDALLTAGLDFEQTDGDGLPQVVRFAGNLERLRSIVQRGADVEVPMYEASTPMHYFAACKHCRNPVAAMTNLVSLGASFNAEDEKGRTPLYKAKRAKLRDTITYLESVGAVSRPGPQQ